MRSDFRARRRRRREREPHTKTEAKWYEILLGGLMAFVIFVGGPCLLVGLLQRYGPRITTSPNSHQNSDSFERPMFTGPCLCPNGSVGTEVMPGMGFDSNGQLGPAVSFGG